MTTPPDSGHEPADLSDLTATDALLDRLGGRDASDDDLLDPAVAILAELVAVIDQAREPDVDAARLIEVLAGRPLYIGGDPAVDTVPLIIDLTEPGPATDAGANETDLGEPFGPGLRLPRPAVVPVRIPVLVPAGPRRWDRVMSHISLPAASVLLLVAVGSGVSAAVTGDPMTPVNGISRVVAQLPGVETSLDKVNSELSMARQAIRERDTPLAAMHLNRARAKLDDVPAADKSQLSRQITEVEIAILEPTVAATDPAEPGESIPAGGGSIPGVITTTAPVTAKPPVSSDPTATATATEVEPSSVPTSTPAQTVAPTTPEVASTTEAPLDDPTPAVLATSP